jgi:hypothetical protein
MSACVLAFAFGTPNALRSNRYIAELASQKARSLGAPIYTQQDVLPVEAGVQIELAQEQYPLRVPTLRIARGAVAWAMARQIEVIWLCAAKPHLARCLRDLGYALSERNARIEVRPILDSCDRSDDFWFCPESTQLDTRYRSLWRIRDTILLHMPMRLYSFIAG